MDLITLLTAVTQPGTEVETPDPCDPASAAAFASLLAGLATPPAGPPSVAIADPTTPIVAPTASVLAVLDTTSGGGEAPTTTDPAVPAPMPLPTAELGAPAVALGHPVPPTPTEGAAAIAPTPPGPAVAAPSPSPAPRHAEATVVEPTAVPAVEATIVATGPTTDTAADEQPADPPLPDVHLTHSLRRHGDLTPAAPLTTDPVVSAPLERLLATQLVDRIGQLGHGPDGDHELTLQLEPAELGRLELRVRLEAGVVHVHVTAEGRDTGDLLRRSLPDLRQLLADAGLTSGSLDVGHHHGRHGAPAEGPTAAATAHRATPSVRPPSARHRPVDPTRGVDVLL